jgi:hypothetical protein
MELETTVVIKAWVLKKSANRNDLLGPEMTFTSSVSLQLSGDCLSRCWRLVQEPHQSLDILCCRCQEELLANELHSS